MRQRPGFPAVRREAAVASLVAGLVMVALVAVASAVRAEGWNEFGLRPAPATAVGDTILEPFFAFVVARAEGDSLGLWHAADLQASARARGRSSRLPVEKLVSLERRRPAPGSEGRHAGARVRAEWVITFDGALGFPLPYSILGYHPGSLRLSRTLVLAELAPQDMTVAWREKREVRRHELRAVRVFALERGHLLLDADAVVDRLLGEVLDDSWTVGFVTAHDGPGRLGLGVMLGRDGRSIYGEFDFARDRIEAHGRSLAGALAGTVRQWLDPAHGKLPAPWLEE
jgi:hypothetical protein